MKTELTGRHTGCILMIEFSFPSAWGGRAAGLPPGLPQSDESVSDGSD